ncbi:mechanosensitive ion channel protein MscS [Bermanella sp. 47_1433_sub80_T6]|nr:mechanosensitive ion channel protein MscS [Bermanella sp. 47_1433_sub80_T6]OUS04855.1 mechanosensitive ion channel protein MscS [Gammaproteobacteria bacterium 42_54_T18]
MTPWLELLEIWWVKALAVFVLGIVVYGLALKLVQKLKIKAGHTRNLFDDAVVGALEKPLNYGILLFTVLAVLNVFELQFDLALLPESSSTVALPFAGLFSWFVLRLIRIRENQILKGVVETKSDKTTISIIFKLLRISVVVLTLLVVFQTLGISISGVIAFGGVGGAAIAFAAKDLLANFFGGLMVFLDKPFKVGDWIRSPDQNIEGTVENIGWRVTRIRTFDRRPLYVPNAVFTQISIENPQRMHHRRIYETIGVRYSDFSQVENICKDIERMLKDHVDIDSEQTLMVNFNRFADSSLEFFIYCFTHTTHWQTFHRIKQDILVEVGQIILQHDAEIAFPSHSVYVETPGPVVE